MIDLIAKIVALVTELGTSLVAYFWARDRTRLQALQALREQEHAIRDASEHGPRDGADAIERLRQGHF